MLLRGAANDPEQLYQALRSMYDEAERLKKLVDDLLYLTKLEQEPQAEFKEGYLDVLLREMEPQLRILAGSRKLAIDIEEQVKCSFDKDRIKQVILNLFHNAIQFTDPKKARSGSPGRNDSVRIAFRITPRISNSTPISSTFYRAILRTRKKAAGLA